MNQRDLLVRIDSEFKDKGFKSAEAAAKAMVRELDRQENEVRKLANLQAQASREEEARNARRLQSMGQVGRGFTALGVAAVAGLGLAAKAAVDWESAWAGVTKTVDGTASEMADLEKEIRGLTKVLPASHDEIAAVAEAAGQLGVKRQDVAAFTRTMIDLGESTNLTANDAATSLARLGNIMGTLPTDADRAGAAIVELGNNSATTEAEIVAMAMRIAGAGKTIGLSQAQVLGFSAALSSVGIEAEAGGSAISRVMVDMASAVNEGGDAVETFAAVSGMSVDDFSQRFKTDAAGAITAFVSGLGRMQSSGQDVFQVLEDLGFAEIRVRDALLRTSQAGDLLTRSVDMGSAAWEANSALVAEASKRYETAESRIKIARNTLNDAAIDIGGTVLPAVAGAADRVGFLAETFQSLPGPVKSSVSTLGGAVGALSLLGGAALMAIPKLKEMNATLALTGPRGAAAAAGLSRAGSALLGPWGLALLAGTVALGVWAEKQYEAKARADELSRSIDLQTGALDVNGKALQAKWLQDSGAFDRARQAGVSIELLTEAASGNTAALRELEAMQERAAAGYQGVALQTGNLQALTDVTNDSVARFGTTQERSANAAADQSAKLLGLLNQVRPLHEQVTDLAGAQGEVAEATSQAASSTDTATGANEGFAAGLGDTAQEAERAAKEIDALIKAIEGYGDIVVNAREANRDYQETLDKVAEREAKRIELQEKLKEAQAKSADTKDEKSAKADEIARIKAELEGYTKSLDANTDAGRANQQLQEDIASKTLARATAYFQEGKSIDEVTDMVMKGRDEFVAFSRKMGASKEEAEALADELGLTRQNVDRLRDSVESVPTARGTNFSASTEDALARVEAYQKAINALPTTYTTRVAFTGTLPNGGRSLGGGQTFDFDSGGYTGDIPRDAVAGRVHGQEYVMPASPTAQWRGLLEDMRRGGDPRAYLGSQAVTAGGTSGPTTYSESYDQRVMPGVMYVTTADSSSFKRDADKTWRSGSRRVL